MTPAIKFENVSIVFGDKPELALPLMDQGLDRTAVQDQTDQVMGVHNCSFDVEEGEIFVLMGLSGSGKSTLLRAVNGLNPVVRGSVHVDAGGSYVDVTKASSHQLRHLRSQRIAMVFQQFGLLPWRTVAENVGLGLELSGMRKKRRREGWHLNSWRWLVLRIGADNKVSELSGGMQQRVGLARAFATEAPILLMDEPFSALDPLIRSKLQDELLDLQEKLKRTILFVSHDLDEAFKLGNRIAILEGGHISQIGKPREIFTKPADSYVADFVAHMNPLGVLRVSDAMTNATASAYEDTVGADMLLANILDAVSRHDKPVGVTSQGKLVGELSGQKVLKFLAGHLGDD